MDAHVIFWFLPEIFELKIVKSIDKMIFDCNNRSPFSIKFVRYFYPDKIDLYTKMRDKGKPDDELTLALQNDDIEKVQSILSKNDDDYSKIVIPMNIYNNIFEDNVKLIDFAALNGSVKCFKFLMLNHSEITQNTLLCAIDGGNTEIIQIADQNLSSQDMKKKQSRQQNEDIDYSLKFIEVTISKHQNNLFDWVLEHKFDQKLIDKNGKSIALKSIKDGNAYSFIAIIDKLTSSCNFQMLIDQSSKNGFYKLTKLLFDIFNHNLDMFKTKSNSNRDFIMKGGFFSLRNEKVDELYYNSNFVDFGSLSIFKLGLKLDTSKSSFQEDLKLCIDKEYKNIYDYFLDDFIKDDSKCDKLNLHEIAKLALTKKSNYYFVHFVDQLKLFKPSFFTECNSYSSLMQQACSRYLNIENIKIILDLIKENEKTVDITTSFIDVAFAGNKEICQYLINNGYIEFNEYNFSRNDSIGLLNKDIFVLIIENSPTELAESFLSSSLYPAIKSKNKDLVEFLLNKGTPYDEALFAAVKSNCADIVNIILKHDNRPVFVNQKSKEGTSLHISVNKNNLEIVKLLLSVQGIDANLYDENYRTPLISSIINFNIDIMNMILDFYGDNIQTQIWQFDEAIKITLENLSNDERNNQQSQRSISNKINDEMIKRQLAVSSDKRINQQLSRLNSNKTNDENENENKEKLIKILKIILKIKNINPNTRGGEYTLLSYACEINEIDIVQMLLETDRIDVNSYSPTTGNTPLMVSILNGNIEIAELLIKDKRTNINARNHQKQTALTISVNNKLDNIVTLLIKNNKFDAYESNLNYAFYISRDSISKLLILTNAVDINCRYVTYTDDYNDNDDDDDEYKYMLYMKMGLRRNKIGYKIGYKTPLTNAAEFNDLQKVNLIIKNPSFDKDKSHLIEAIFISVKNNAIDAFNAMMKFNNNDLNIRSNYNGKSLIDSINKSSIKMLEPILKNEEFHVDSNIVVDLFVKSLNEHDFSSEVSNFIYKCDCEYSHVIDINKPLSNGKSYFTSLNNHCDCENVIDYLLDLGADPNIPDGNGLYPLEYAILSDNYEIASTLIKSRKVDLNKQIQIKNDKTIYQIYHCRYTYDPIKILNSKYASYLHVAALSNSKLIKLLLRQNSIDINIEDDQGNTALIYACLSKKHFIENDNSDKKIFKFFKSDDLDYLHCNKEGKDALKILGCENIPQNKSEYLSQILKNLKLHGKEILITRNNLPSTSNQSKFNFNFSKK